METTKKQGGWARWDAGLRVGVAPTTLERLRREAARRNTTLSAVVREAIERGLATAQEVERDTAHH